MRGEPSWNSTYQTLLDSSEKLTLLREYRDTILLQHPNGRFQVKRLYSQSNELLTILNLNPQFIIEAQRIIEKNLPEIQKILNHQEGILQDTQGIQTFIENFASHSSLRTKLWLSSLQNKLERCRRTRRKFFGFDVQATGERRLNR